MQNITTILPKNSSNEYYILGASFVATVGAGIFSDC